MIWQLIEYMDWLGKDLVKRKFELMRTVMSGGKERKKFFLKGNEILNY